MRQFQFGYETEEKFINSLRRIRQWCNSSMTSEVLFQIYTESLEEEVILGITDMIHRELPNSVYMGTSTNGNIIMGEKSKMAITVNCTVFEYADTKVELLQYPLTEEEARSTVDCLLAEVAKRPWVKAILLNTTIRGMSMSSFCEYISKLPKEIQVFGGGAFSADMNEDEAFVFSSVGKISDHSVVFALIGGEDFHVMSGFITGWKPLGRGLKVTSAKGTKLEELDGRPAYETYYKYLNIKNDEHFFVNTLEFPFFYEFNGINILRAPIASNPDGSLTMTAEIPENVVARIAYGDPWTILEEVHDKAKALREFSPEAVMVFSCGGRRTFWGDAEISKETAPFQMIAPTSGFYTSGEFLRTNEFVNQHNVTLVVGAMREGPAVGSDEKLEIGEEEFSGKVSMINRLATFIQAATEELEEANKRLAKAAVSDGLTGLYNRVEIQHRITAKADELAAGKAKQPASIIMMDIDNFKKVNDTYGHREGDIVLKELANILRNITTEVVPDGKSGRWGGEEFMVLLPSSDEAKAIEVAEKIRLDFLNIEFPKAKHQTISLGVTQLIPGEDSDTGAMRADDALYDAKHLGKNCVKVH